MFSHCFSLSLRLFLFELHTHTHTLSLSFQLTQKGERERQAGHETVPNDSHQTELDRSLLHFFILSLWNHFIQFLKPKINERFLIIEAYKKALDLSVEEFEKAQMYEAIASSYKMFDVPQAIAPLTRAAETHMQQGKWTMASQTLEKVAELYEQMNDLDNMMKCLKEAHRFLKQEGQKAGANRVQKKMAETLALQHQFMRAQQEYEEMADKTKDDPLLKYGAKDFWLRATMCALCIDSENANTALTRYLNDNPLFEERSLEVKLIRQLIAAVEEQNKELFLKHIDDTPLSTLRADRVFRSLTEDIAKKINGDIDLK